MSLLTYVQKVAATFWLSLASFSGLAPAHAAEPPIPGVRVTVRAQALGGDRESWAKARFSVLGEPRLRLKGDWESVGTNDLKEFPEEPALVAGVYFQVDRSVSIVKKGLSVFSYPPRSPTDPARTYFVELALKGGVTPMSLTLVDPLGKTLEARLAFTLQAPRIVVLKDPACGDSGIDLDADSPGAPGSDKDGSASPVVFARCVLTGRSVRIKLWSWQELRWSPLAQDASALWKMSRDHPILVGTIPRETQNGSPRTFQFSLEPAQGGGTPQSITLAQHELKAPAWHLIAALGPTFSNYNESVTGLPSVQVAQVGLTAKVNVQYKFLPSRWDAALSVFGTVLPLTVSPSSEVGARWLGISLRAGYTFPLDSVGRNTLSLLPGVYFWSMFVPGQVYGIQNLNGPQFVLAYGHEFGSRTGRGLFRWAGAYFKAAIMDASLGLSSLSNHEFAAGGQVTLRLFGLSHPFAFSVDASTLAFAQTDFSMSLTTLSFSLGYAFF